MSERRREHQRAKGIVAALAVAVLAAACSGPLTTREKGAIAGGAIGAGTGAIIGNQVGHTGTGALIGAGIGVVSGAVIGDAIQGAEQKAAQRPVTSPAAAPPPASVAVAPPARRGRPGSADGVGAGVGDARSRGPRHRLLQ